MAPFAPFERRPSLGVAVSGGRDSMALCLLADEWAGARGGAAQAFTVDHGLRAESREECAQVSRWLGQRGIPCRTLTWRGVKPRAGIQDAARDARYRLLEAACLESGILHLLLAHHLDDQCETAGLRQERRSGANGLAAIPAIRETRALRVLRPLLTIPRARLTSTLRQRGQSWLDDPSNRDPRFARARWRLAPGDRTGFNGDTAATIHRAGAARRAREEQAADLAAQAAHVDPAGFVWLRGGVMRDAPDAVARHVVARCLMLVGGKTYPPRGARLDALCVALLDGRGSGLARTLAGCVVRAQGECILIAREPGRIALPTPWCAAIAGTLTWDARFQWTRLPGRRAGPDLSIGALTAVGLAALPEPVRKPGHPPRIVRLGLPTLRAADEPGGPPLAVPHLGYWDPPPGVSRAALGAVHWAPPVPLAGAPFQPMLDPAAQEC